jgi:hypothetical protein
MKIRFASCGPLTTQPYRSQAPGYGRGLEAIVSVLMRGSLKGVVDSGGVLDFDN